jgi:hypothetical protein
MRFGHAVWSPLNTGFAGVAGAVVHDPEHALGRGVGLGGHDLLNEPAERLDPGLLLTATEQSALGVMYVAPDRGARDRADDPALDSLSRDLSVRPARQRSTRLGRKLAGQRFDLRDLCGGKTTGAGQASASHPTQAVLLRTIVAATYAHIAQSHPLGERSQHWSLPSSEQHDLRANHFTMRTGVLASSMAQLPLLGLAQLDQILAGHYQQDSQTLWEVLQPARNIFPA